jgi:hypothetical protein
MQTDVQITQTLRHPRFHPRRHAHGQVSSWWRVWVSAFFFVASALCALLVFKQN